MLNAPARSMTKADIVKYIRTFDQKTHQLLGVFDKQSGRHIGFFTIDIDGVRRHGLVNLLIGEPEVRNHGVLSNVRRQFAEYFFHTLGLKTMKATALSRNTIILDTLVKAGWVIRNIAGTRQGACGRSVARPLPAQPFPRYLARPEWESLWTQYRRLTRAAALLG